MKRLSLFAGALALAAIIAGSGYAITKVPVTMLDATGTPSASTYLRGDGSWNNPAVSDGDKGDVTVSGSGATWTIDSNAVTYSKMQDVSATARLIGRKTSGSGDPEELTLTETL